MTLYSAHNQPSRDVRIDAELETDAEKNARIKRAEKNAIQCIDAKMPSDDEITLDKDEFIPELDDEDDEDKDEDEDDNEEDGKDERTEDEKSNVDVIANFFKTEFAPIDTRHRTLNKNGKVLGRPRMSSKYTTIVANRALRLAYERVAIKYKEEIAAALAKKAIRGNIPAIKELGDRIMGRAIEQVKVEVAKTLNVDI